MIDVGGQQLEFDLDMLAPDFYTVMTTSGKGSKYDTFASRTHSTQHPKSLQNIPKADRAYQSTTTPFYTLSAAAQAISSHSLPTRPPRS
jgi:hypothetical protein